MMRTRIKICGLTRAEDVDAAVGAGTDAIGFNCYSGSPRYVPATRLAALAARLPPFVTPVLVLVNATAEQIAAALAAAPQAILQFHGDESAAQCELFSNQFARPYLRAVRMTADIDLLNCERSFSSAGALMVDAPAPGFGGGGKAFDWTWLPAVQRRSKPLVLAGGLNASNVAEGIRQVRPFAVDVASGVESAPGIKDARLIHRFMAAVRAADADNRDA